MTELSPPSIPAPGPPELPLGSYRSALVRYEAADLAEILRALAVEARTSGASTWPEAIAAHLVGRGVAGSLAAGLAADARLALGLFALAEA
ncbi:MAG TPA: hypothetical protein VF590_12900, partial [Isosphaeraceae bacterium]